MSVYYVGRPPDQANRAIDQLARLDLGQRPLLVCHLILHLEKAAKLSALCRGELWDLLLEERKRRAVVN